MEYCLVGFLMLVGLLLFLRFFVMAATVISQSMSPTLEIGDRVLCIRHWPIRWLRKGQIVVIRPTADYPSSLVEPYGMVPLIKRVIWVKGPLPSFAGEPGVKKEYALPNRFIVNGDLSIRENNMDHLGVIPYSHLLAVVFLKLSDGKRNESA